MNANIISKDELESASILQQFSNGFVSNINPSINNNNNNNNNGTSNSNNGTNIFSNSSNSSNISNAIINDASPSSDSRYLPGSHSFSSTITPNSTSSPNSHAPNNCDESSIFLETYEQDTPSVRQFNLRSKSKFYATSDESKDANEATRRKRFKEYESDEDGADDDDDDDSDLEDDDTGRKGSKRKRIRHPVFPLWTIEEDEILLEKNLELGNDWAKISTYLPGRSRVDVKVRYKSIFSASKKLWNAKDDEKIFTLYRQHNADWKTIATYFEGRTKNAVRVRYKELKRLAFQPIKAPPSGSAKQIFYKRHHPHFHRNSTRADPLGLRAEARKEELLRRQEIKCEKCSNCACCGQRINDKSSDLDKIDHNDKTEKTIQRSEDNPLSSNDIQVLPIDNSENENSLQTVPNQIPNQDQSGSISAPVISNSFVNSNSNMINNKNHSSTQNTLQNPGNLPLLSNVFPGLAWNTPPNMLRFSSPHMFPQAGSAIATGSKYPFICPMFPQLQQFPLMNPKGI